MEHHNRDPHPPPSVLPCAPSWSRHRFAIGIDQLPRLVVRTRQAAAWCATDPGGPDRTRWLRSPELRPRDLDPSVPPWREVPTIRARTHLLSVRRARLLDVRCAELPTLRVALRHGRLLGHDLAACTGGEFAYACSSMFDASDAPGWDAWIDCVTHDDVALDGTRAMHLSWIPNRFVAEVALAMGAGVECLQWVRPERLGMHGVDVASEMPRHA